MKAHLTPDFAMEYDDAGQGSVVVLLHAFPLSREMWQPQVSALKEEFRVLVPDLRGFGGTDGGLGEAPSIGRMADDVRHLLDALEIDEPITLCGLSMGGYIALAFAREFPQRLRGLVLADTRAEADTEEGKTKRNEMIELARAHGARGVIEKMLPNLVGESTRRERAEVAETVKQLGAAQRTAGIVAALQALRDRPDATPGLADIQAPTLVVVGHEDTLTPPSLATILALGIEGAELEVIEGAGHLSNLEQPAAFNKVLLNFLVP